VKLNSKINIRLLQVEPSIVIVFMLTVVYACVIAIVIAPMIAKVIA